MQPGANVGMPGKAKTQVLSSLVYNTLLEVEAEADGEALEGEVGVALGEGAGTGA